MLEGYEEGQKYGATLAESTKGNQLSSSEVLSQTVNYMPHEDPNYEWRIRVDIRSGVDMPLN
jgi:hypothetical protein